ncbi:MAG TPA: DUF1700 domain-containing protein [Rhizomicrobium sp.]|jgi:uncharacterized membrane protein|nr:DUF1700 domain-containing protein [Rhizomicrobium sp.]
MNRVTFMAQLRRGLAGLPPEEIEEIAADYERHFADGAADGRSEDEVSVALGDPTRLARELRAEIGFKRWEQDRTAGNFLGVVLALLGLATIDIMFIIPLLCALAGIFFGLAVACLALIVGGAFLLFNLLPFGWHGAMQNSIMQALLGIGLISGAVGGGALLMLAVDVTARLLIRYARLHFRLFDSASHSV